jgi:alpha-L-fucosidase
MSISRRTLMKMMAGAVPAAIAARAAGQGMWPVEGPAVTPGPFMGTRESLAGYQVPAWLNDAKFGIWAHWGPQSAPEQGDWSARNMYIQGSKQNLYHVQNYGPPSKFGYKDVIPTWKGDKFDPDYLMQLYKKAGAKYFVSMGVHHDNFDMWDSKYHQWNAAKMGIKRDVVGEWRKAAQEHGLRFGVSDHLWISYKWFSVSHMADQTGPLAGVPYDGADPRWYDLYHDYSVTGVPQVTPDWNDGGIPEAWRHEWFTRIQDLYTHYQPDMLYIDGPIPFEEIGLGLVADFYNRAAARNGGAVDVVYTSKRREDCETGTCALDVERGVVESIWPRPWQTDTCIGNWHYQRDIVYKTPKRVVDMLVDIVSRNGNLLLNFPLPNSGMLDDRELAVLDGITKWMAVNSDAIYSSRPWKIFGAGPSTAPAAAPAPAAAGAPGNARPPSAFNERDRQDLTEADVRFTTKAGALYAFVMGVPGDTAVITPLGTSSAVAMGGKVTNVELLGAPGKLDWSQDADALRVKLPAEKPCDYAIVFRVSGLAV